MAVSVAISSRIATLLLLAGTSVGQTSPCLDQLANRIAAGVGAGSGYVVKPQPGGVPVWLWRDGGWVLGTMYGAAVGAVAPGSPDIWVWPSAFGTTGAGLCDPEMLGKIFGVLAHELMHFLCPPHTPGPAGGQVFDPTKKPDVDGAPPDCNDINYAVGAAKQICDEITDILECLADPECEGLKDENGNVIPGLERDNLDEYCKGLADAHQKIQDNTNTPGNAETAFNCNCPDSWSPGPGYGNCPTMGPPPGGCAGTAADAYPNNEIVPECPNSCP